MKKPLQLSLVKNITFAVLMLYCEVLFAKPDTASIGTEIITQRYNAHLQNSVQSLTIARDHAAEWATSLDLQPSQILIDNSDNSRLFALTASNTSDPKLPPRPTGLSITREDDKCQPPPSKTIWKPAPGTTWQWQLTKKIDPSIDVQKYDIDLFDTPQSTIDQLHSQGRIVICYFSAGSWEKWRPDSKSFPNSVLGKGNGWAGEKWLDIRKLGILGPIMKARLNMAVKKGCDGVEPDNVDGYTNNTGFPLTYHDQLKFNKWLASEAHKRGLSIGLKNALELVKDLLDDYDWALNEQCFEYNECELLLPFVQAGKAVFGVEYNKKPEFFCPKANAMKFSWLKKKIDLDTWRIDCRDF